MHATLIKLKSRPLNRALRILLCTHGAILTASSAIGPIYALFVEKVGGDLLDARLAGTVFALATGLAMMVSGKFSNEAKQKEKLLSLGYAIVGIGFILYIFVGSIWELLLVQVIIGIGTAIYT